LDKDSTLSRTWADTADRLWANEAFMEANGFVICMHRSKPKGQPMAYRTAVPNGQKSKIRALVEHVFAEQKSRMGQPIRTIGIARTILKTWIPNTVYNVRRLNYIQKTAIT
jgi:IS5 family transposase